MKFSFRIIIITIMVINNIAYAKNDTNLSISASIIPLQSLVQMVIDGTHNSVNVILDNSNTSPHDSTINYREMKIIKNSSILFVVSKNFEQEIIKNVDAKTKIIYLDEKLNSPLNDFNELSYKKASHNEEHEHSHDHNDHHHSHDVKDYHIWLDTNKTQQILYVVANELALLDTQNKAKYLENAKKYSAKIQDLQAEITKDLASIKGSFMVYHNAWGYFVKQNSLYKNYKGSIIANEADHSHIDTNLSAKNVIELSNYLLKEKVSCILLEPQFEDKTVQTIIKKNNLKTAILDPIGKQNKDLTTNYFIMMKKNTQQLKSCV